MAQLEKYIWLIDTIQRHGSITLRELSDQWEKSSHGEGAPLPRRTFYSYRQAIMDIFHIDIKVNPHNFEYSIDEYDTPSEKRLRQWLLESVSISDALNDSTSVSGRIQLEKVPSARQHLRSLIDAIKGNFVVQFDYKPYNRLEGKNGIKMRPYFVKIFKQVWYVIGYVREDNKVKTYALDRIHDLRLTTDTFEMPENFEPESFFRDYYGITQNDDIAKDIVLKATPLQARYLIATPLHHSQKEEYHDQYVLLRYKMHITYDLVQEILKYGREITVVEPKELVDAVVKQLRASLANYEL